MTKRRSREWEADLDASDQGRPGHYAAARAIEAIDDAEHDAYWRHNFERETYCQPGQSYDYYETAFQVGYEGCARYRDMGFDEAEPELQAEYDRRTTPSHPRWHEVRDAARSAWNRAKRLIADRA
jgi:hypothetical protein